MTTVVVVGSGIAGLTAALHAHEAGCRVTVVTKGALPDTNTRWAQGGIAAATDRADTVSSHAADTMTAGAGLNDPAAVDVLVGEGPARIAELVARGVAFDRTADGEFSRGLEAAHTVPRVLHAGGDATGAEIQAALGAAVRAAGIPVREHAAICVSRAAASSVSSSTTANASTPTLSSWRQEAPVSSTPTRRTRPVRPETASPRPCAPEPRSPTWSSSSSTPPPSPWAPPSSSPKRCAEKVPS